VPEQSDQPRSCLCKTVFQFLLEKSCMLYLYPPALTSIANKILQHESTVHRLLFQPTTEEQSHGICTFSFCSPCARAKRNFCRRSNQIRSWAPHPIFMSSTVPLTLPLPLSLPRQTGSSYCNADTVS